MSAVTNIHNLPTALVRAVENDPYVGGGDISVTKLIDAPQRRVLWKKHAPSITTDVSERIWALLGQAVHHILERAGDDALAEERLYAKVDGWEVSGQFDRLHLGDGVLQDYKVTTTYKAEGSPQWEAQLNCLRWLAFQNGYDVDRLEIVAIFRDWRKVEADRNADYPRTAVQVIPVKVWSLDEAEAYIRGRVRQHQAAEAGAVTLCTDDERWYSGDKWAVQKPGAKRALRVYDEKPVEVPDGYELVFRRGEYKRCAHYCEVAPFCSQWGSDRPPVTTDDT